MVVDKLVVIFFVNNGCCQKLLCDLFVIFGVRVQALSWRV